MDERAEVLPRPEEPFGGYIARKVQDSIKDFRKEARVPKGVPNILLILTDDVGFGVTSTFGGPIPTPTFDRLAGWRQKVKVNTNLSAVERSGWFAILW